MRPKQVDPQGLLARLQALRQRVETEGAEQVEGLATEVQSLLEQLQSAMVTSAFLGDAEPPTGKHRAAGGTFEQSPSGAFAKTEPPGGAPVVRADEAQLWPGAGIEDTTAEVTRRQSNPKAERGGLLDSVSEVLEVADLLLLRAKFPALWAANELAAQLVARTHAAECRALARELALLRKKKKELEDAKKLAASVEGDQWSHASRVIMTDAALLAGSLERLQQAYALATELEGG